mmetsp:Transcript_87997/g.138956  ORF Transcript_87997/g.138956 Transcript_87997/m.138956 type:complete len:306 (-) Transcript_87997:19-936(-)
MAESRLVDHHIMLPEKLARLVEEGSTSWYLLQMLDSKLDWRTALDKARLHIDGDVCGLSAPNAAGLGTLIDEESIPRQMLVLKPMRDGLKSAGKVSACIKIGSLLPHEDNFDGVGYKIIPVQALEESKGAPLVFWTLCHSLPEDEILNSLSFKALSRKLGDRHCKLYGSIPQAPRLQLIGDRMKPNGTKYLLGGVAHGSKKMFVCEADVYAVQRDGEFGRDKAEEERLEAEERKAMDFRTQRGEAIKLAANVTKQRQEASKEMRMVDETKVADMEDCVSEMNKKAMSAIDMELKPGNLRKKRKKG